VSVLVHHLPVVAATGIATLVALFALHRGDATDGPILVGLLMIYLLLSLSRGDAGRHQPARRGTRRG
jgi:hypothetical protein